jgi:hypothetical protein
MGIKSARSFFINKILFPKILIINEPGIIISKTLQIVNSKRRRMVYDFEEVLVGLQSETLKKLGDKAASDLFYKIGKDVGVQYGFFMGKNKVPKFLRKSTIEYFFARLGSVGMSFGRKAVFNEKDNSLILHGEDSLICRKTQNSWMFAGVASGLLSFVICKNIEAEPRCKNCSKSCSIIANENIPARYIPNSNELCIDKNYEKFNFPEKTSRSNNAPALNKFYDFKKITILDDGKSYFDGRALFFSEAHMMGIVAKNYLIANKDIFEDAIIKYSEELSSYLFRAMDKEEDKIKYFCGILSAFGYGIPSLLKDGREITIRLMHPPITRYGLLYFVLEVNGFLNTLYNTSFKLVKIKEIYNPIVTSISYVEN